ncbi:MAG: phosphomannomutase [Verrucomicrobia bacterium Tous-C9LFEB]|nr:MAG: phosphomannomutase [Verrucomicrobia bacterium Tous-C9LFEB]
MKPLRELLAVEPASKELLPSTVENILRVYESAETPAWGRLSIEELVAAGEWTELNDRFFKKLAFGTGGIRGRTIGRKVTQVELGTPGELGRPEHAAIGSNMFNAVNVRRAAQGTGQYLLKYFKGQKIKGVVSHDTRHFSRFFAELVAQAWAELGIEVYLFPEDRSTPQLSYSVRWLKAQVGVMITASHNPSHDNGYKAYFADGGQLVEPHASGVIAEVNALDVTPLPPFTGTPAPIHILDSSADDAYRNEVSTLVLEPETIKASQGKLKIVYTPVHGTGRRIIPSLLKQWGFDFSVVAQQDQADGRFPTVASPNPENAEALQLGVDQAKAEGADIVLATDPDADRMGVICRNGKGEFEIITGNMIGSIMAAYRTERFFAKGIVNDANKAHAALIKTFVTTDLQKKIAEHYGIKCVNTLTGFKYIGEKMLDYEKASGLADYDAQPIEKQRAAQLEKGTFFIFGGEESYGYSGGDYVRDKDANAAVLMFAEVAAWAKVNGQTIIDYLDAVYKKFGYFTEKLGTLTFEGAVGAAQIQKLLKSYRENPPKQMKGSDVVAVEDFGKQDYKDVDGKVIPKETMLLFHLANGSRMAVRGSGTEPKIKFYFFTQAEVKTDLATVKAERKAYLNDWWTEVQADVQERVK